MSQWVVIIENWGTLDASETSKAVKELAAQIEKRFPADKKPPIELAEDLGLVVVECDDASAKKLEQLPGAKKPYKAAPRRQLQTPAL